MCPYLKHEPLTQEGFEVWEIVRRCGGQLRFYPNGSVAGFDISAVLSVTQALGYDLQAVLCLLDSAESGLSEAVRKHGDGNSEHIR